MIWLADVQRKKRNVLVLNSDLKEEFKFVYNFKPIFAF